jgi:hypothetical protein
MGRFLVSRKIFAKYLPIIPKANSCRPPIKRIIVTKLAQPEILPPNVIFRITTNRIPKSERKNEHIPAQVARFRGASEKLTNPSIEYRTRLQKVQVVRPAIRCRFS